MHPYLDMFVRTMIAIAAIYVFSKLNGTRLISQLTFYDYIVGITAGSISAAMCIELDIDMWLCVVAIAIFMSSAHLFSYLSNKSMVLRRILAGKPIALMKDGEIVWSGLKKAFFDVNDLMRELRCQGYFDLSQINCAILETNGQVSVLLKANSRPATASEQGMALEEDTVPATLIIDGKIIQGNLKASGFDEKWIKQQLKNQDIAAMDEIAVATLSEGKLSVYKKTYHENRTIFQ